MSRPTSAALARDARPRTKERTVAGALVPEQLRPRIAEHQAKPSPVAIYLDRLADGSRPRILGALTTLAGWIAPGVDVEEIPWERLRYEHTSALRARAVAAYAPASVTVMMAALRGVLRQCHRLRTIHPDDYTRAIDLDAVTARRVTVGRAVSPGELSALFTAAAGVSQWGYSRDRRPAARDGALLALLYGCGLRRAELCNLTLADLDTAGATLHVPGKGARERIVPIPSGTLRALDAWLKYRGSEPGPLIVNMDRRNARGVLAPLTGKSVRLILRRLAKSARVPVTNPHDLRRSVAGDMLDQGTDLPTVQKILGHASPVTTQKYDRRDGRAAAAAAARLHVPY